MLSKKTISQKNIKFIHFGYSPSQNYFFGNVMKARTIAKTHEINNFFKGIKVFY